MLQGRSLIALAAIVVALFWSKPADAQVPPPQTAGEVVNEVVTGVAYDRLNQAKAFRSLSYREVKLERDARRGHSAAADRDVRKIESLKYRIVVDEWLIRQNSLQNPGCYPHPLRLDPITCAALAEARRIGPSPYYPPRP